MVFVKPSSKVWRGTQCNSFSALSLFACQREGSILEFFRELHSGLTLLPINLIIFHTTSSILYWVPEPILKIPPDVFSLYSIASRYASTTSSIKIKSLRSEEHTSEL